MQEIQEKTVAEIKVNQVDEEEKQE